MNVRRSYNRRRQNANIGFDDPFDLPVNYQITKIGALRSIFGQEITEDHR